MSTFHYALPSLASALALGPVAACGAEPAERPNLLFILCDQFRASAIGCLGQEPVLTPALDHLASQGVVLTQAVSNYPVSSPARAMLMTGLYPHQNRVTGNCNSTNAPFGVELQQSARCWSDVLHDEGYHTAWIGKWHLDSPHEPYIDCYNNHGAVKWNEWCPPERRHGFEYWVAYGTYDRHLHPLYWNTRGGRGDYYYADRWGPQYEADCAIDYLAAHAKDQAPFAMVVSMNPPHTDVTQVPERYRALYRDLPVDRLSDRPDLPKDNPRAVRMFRNTLADYYACVSGVDDQIGRILHALDSLSLTGRTLVVFTSDHGACMGLHGVDGKNIYYEEAMRVPMIFRWPGRLTPRRDAETMMSVGDFYGTLLSLMGLGHKIPAEVQTRDYSAQVEGSGAPRTDDFQPYYFIDTPHAGTGKRGLRTATHTFAVLATAGREDSVVLFDRRTDPFELHNIAAQQPRLVKQMRSRLKRFLRHTDDPFAAYMR